MDFGAFLWEKVGVGPVVAIILKSRTVRFPMLHGRGFQ
jgi:hypothetical protein